MKLFVAFFCVLLLAGCSSQLDCSSYKESFDLYAQRSTLPFIEDENSLCHGVRFDADLSKLESKWAVGELVSVNGSMHVFAGVEENVTFFITDGDYQVGKEYLLDMNDVCRQFFMMADSRAPSPHEKTIVGPKEVSCS